MIYLLGLLIIILIIAFFIFGGQNPPSVFHAMQMPKRQRLSGEASKLLERRFGEIEELLNMSGIARNHQAIIQMDRLIDLALKDLGLVGETLGERLKGAKYLYTKNRSAYDQLWELHKLRNVVVHEENIEVPQAQVKVLLEQTKKALQVIHD